ncbi:hypothetical protein G5I_10032 [Acromyrmex echinatior]|uniref:Uncharacterized protein n=1 Tax=Acromyrmex echinatior TaxID=103372 RepID=F4WVT0_ACREC|nr:hypothetical protein G5I_10032 [Acromyrmex echinatior]
MLDHLVSHSSSGTFDIAYYKRVCARCMPNAVEEFLAIFLRVRGRLIVSTAEINEQKRERERMAIRLYANNEAADTVPVFTVRQRTPHTNRDCDNIKPSRQISTTRVSRANDTRSWLGNEANSIIERKRQIAPQNRKLIIELVHEDDPASPIYYAKHFDPGRRSVAETNSIAKKHPNELDHVKIKSDVFSKGSSGEVSYTTEVNFFTYIPDNIPRYIEIQQQHAADEATKSTRRVRRRDIQRRGAQDEEVGVNRYIDTGHFFLPINSQTTLAGLRI